MAPSSALTVSYCITVHWAPAGFKVSILTIEAYHTFVKVYTTVYCTIVHWMPAGSSPEGCPIGTIALTISYCTTVHWAPAGNSPEGAGPTNRYHWQPRQS